MATLMLWLALANYPTSPPATIYVPRMPPATGCLTEPGQPCPTPTPARKAGR